MARNDDEIRQVPLSELKSEEGAHDLATSPNMEPYLRLAMAELNTIPGYARVVHVRRQDQWQNDSGKPCLANFRDNPAGLPAAI